jgi:hypothetical protein
MADIKKIKIGNTTYDIAVSSIDKVAGLRERLKDHHSVEGNVLVIGESTGSENEATETITQIKGINNKIYNIEDTGAAREDHDHDDTYVKIDSLGIKNVEGTTVVDNNLDVNGIVNLNKGLHLKSDEANVVFDSDIPTNIDANLTVTGETHLGTTYITGPVDISSGETNIHNFQLKNYSNVHIHGNTVDLIGDHVTAPSNANLNEGMLGNYKAEDDITTDSQDIINKEVLYNYNSKVNSKIRTLEEQTFSMYGSKNQANIQRVEETEVIENPVEGQIACFFATTNSLSQGGTGAPGAYPVVKQTYKRYDGTN